MDTRFLCLTSQCQVLSDCLDKLTMCSYYSHVCTENTDWARQYCSFYCNMCDQISNSTPPQTTRQVTTTSAPGLRACTYKGHTYGDKEHWLDGCTYNCTCVDASKGFWKCSDMCPNYGNLPKPYCHLVVVPGNCCKVPKCDFSILPS